MAVNLHATHFRFGIDSGTESTHGWHANEDVNPAAGVLPLDAVFLLRFNVQETGGTAAANTDFTWQFQINGGGFVNLTTTSVGPRAVAAVALTNGGNCTKRLSGTGTFETTAAGQTEDGSSGGASNDMAASGCSETECGIIIDSADVNDGDVIEFRLTSPDFTITNDVVPRFTVVLPVRRGLIGWAEFEGPNAPRRAVIGWVEAEAPNAPRRAIIGWAEQEFPDLAPQPRGAVIGWSEVEFGNGPRKAVIGWGQFEHGGVNLASVLMQLQNVCAGGNHYTCTMTLNGGVTRTVTVETSQMLEEWTEEDDRLFAIYCLRLHKIGKNWAQMQADLNSGFTVTV